MSLAREKKIGIINQFRAVRLVAAFFCFFSCVFFAGVSGRAQEGVEPERLISIELVHQPLRIVIDEISKQSGYAVRIDEKIASIPVSGKFKDVTIDSFFQRALRGQNVSVLFDDKNGFISVRSFGRKDSEVNYIVSNGDGNESFLPVDQQKIKQLHALQEHQIKEYENNPESVEPFTGIKLADIKSLHARQERQIEEYENNPKSVEPLTRMKLADIKLLHDRQEREINEYENDPKAVEPLTGMKLKDIQSLHARQERQIEEYENDPDAVEPLTGIRLSEIRALHKRQQQIIDGLSR